MFSKNGTELFCFYDTQELYTFKFHDGYSLDQIESICHRDNSYPINGKLVKHGQQILPLNQTGFSSDVPTKEWSTSSTSLMKNVGPIVDIQQIRETMYFVSGSAPSSALYQAKKGLTIESDIQDHILGSIEFDRRIDKLWIFGDLALIQFLEGDQALFQFDGGNVTEITAPPIDMDRETLAIMADVTSNGWKLIFQLV
ncbi:hypothetical protein FGO68_gene2789 [Halteria grandinella]|uniref:Uncharacterized protein n=1 Tax=Halteria grandinella TaxID=5974 RepID=A0A8J8NFB5_HALGN|nr:hypothetical protein FGO68_gene2789 [Halteria grandinella]